MHIVKTLDFLPLFPSVGIYEDHQDENKQAIYSELAKGRKSATVTCTWMRLKEWKSFMVNKREGFRWALIVGCWQGEAGFGLIRNRESSTSGLGSIPVFLWLGPELQVRSGNKKLGRY